jgi:hypothetical protein
MSVKGKVTAPLGRCTMAPENRDTGAGSLRVRGPSLMQIVAFAACTAFLVLYGYSAFKAAGSGCSSRRRSRSSPTSASSAEVVFAHREKYCHSGAWPPPTITAPLAGVQEGDDGPFLRSLKTANLQGKSSGFAISALWGPQWTRLPSPMTYAREKEVATSFRTGVLIRGAGKRVAFNHASMFPDDD